MATYTGLEDVKRVLRTLSGEKIRFSDSVLDVVALKSDNKTNFDLSFNYRLITFDPDFGRSYMLKFVMDTSEDFKVFEVNTVAKRELLLSAGSVNNDYTTPDGMITVPSTVWGGVVTAGDKVEIRLAPHMSDNNGEEYIRDAEVIIDQILESNGIHFPVEGQPTIFLSGAVPSPIRVSTTYLAAYMIHTDTFAELYRDEDQNQVSFLNRWQKRSEDLIKEYIIAKGARPPQAIAFPWFIDSIGVPGVGPGLSKVTSDFDAITRDAQAGRIFGD
jgi:hypothetical protein